MSSSFLKDGILPSNLQKDLKLKRPSVTILKREYKFIFEFKIVQYSFYIELLILIIDQATNVSM